MLPPERRREKQGHQRKTREEQRRAPGRHVFQPDVQQQNQDAELRDAEHRDGKSVAAGETRPAGMDGQGQQDQEPDQVAQHRQRCRRGLLDDESGRYDGRTDLYPGARRGCGGQPGPVATQSFSSQVWPVIGRPKPSKGSSWTSWKPACT